MMDGGCDWQRFMKAEVTKRQNLNRRYMRLDMWQRGMDLFEIVFRAARGVSDFKLRSQVNDASQSVSANIGAPSSIIRRFA